MIDPNTRINHAQKLLTKAQFKKLVANHRSSETNLPPVVKFFGGRAHTWLLSELDPETGIAFGLCDVGQGTPELGEVSLYEMMEVVFPPLNLPVERDLHFKGRHPMSYYADRATEVGRIEA